MAHNEQVKNLRVGLMPYLNSEVFYRNLPAERTVLVSLPPRAMAAAVERGELDAGPLPLAEVVRLGEMLRPVGDFCIATSGRVKSVLLLTKVPVGQLGGMPVAVTSHTATSIQLLRVLFAERWHVHPGSYVEINEPHEAKLIIGDEALRYRKDHPGYGHVYDLGEEWQSLTGLPFVFAVWAMRTGCEAQSSAGLASALERSINISLTQVDAISRERKTSYLTEAEVAEYVRSFTYRLGPEEYRAMDEFKARLSRLPAWRPALVRQV
ncbi:MAG: hypothetical protein EXR44_00200 [Dehalococcoidia bacterium]|nr:hypothetical protein [Dehalococcoidia bacterium]